MNRKKSMEIALLISAVFALLGVYWKITDQPAPPPQPPAMEQQGGSEKLEALPPFSERNPGSSGNTTSNSNDKMNPISR